MTSQAEKIQNAEAAKFDAIKIASDDSETELGEFEIANYTDLAEINRTFGIEALDYTRSGLGGEQVDYFGPGGRHLLILFRN